MERREGGRRDGEKRRRKKEIEIRRKMRCIKLIKFD